MKSLIVFSSSANDKIYFRLQMISLSSNEVLLMNCRLHVFCVLLFATLTLSGCPKQQNSAGNNGSNTSDKPPFSLHRVGIPKYDRYFRRVYDLRYKLWKADRDMARTPATLHGVMALPGNVKGASIGDLLKVAAAKFGNKIMFNGSRVGLRAGVNDPKAARVAQTLDNVYRTSQSLPKNLGGAVGESKNLVVQGQRLMGSVKSDFTGFNALKVPSVTAKLAESTKEMAKVPGQVGKLGGTSVNVAKAIPSMFK